MCQLPYLTSDENINGPCLRCSVAGALQSAADHAREAISDALKAAAETLPNVPKATAETVAAVAAAAAAAAAHISEYVAYAVHNRFDRHIAASCRDVAER